MRTIIASLSIFYFAFLKAFIVSDRNLTRREYAVYSAVSFVLVLMLWLVFVGTVSDIAKENGWALMPDFIEELYSPWERTFGMILIGALLAQIPITWLKFHSYPTHLSNEGVGKWRGDMVKDVFNRNMLILVCFGFDLHLNHHHIQRLVYPIFHL